MSKVVKIVGLNFDHVLYIEIIEEEIFKRKTKVIETIYFAVLENCKIEINHDTYIRYLDYIGKK